MVNLPIQLKYSLAPLMVVFVSIILASTEPLSSEWLAYDKQQIVQWQWWRLITGHLLHTNSMHLLMNVTGLILLWALHGHYYPRFQYLIVFVLLCLGTSGAIYLFAPQMQWYVGLSGVLHGLFAIGAYFDIQNKLKTGWLMIIGLWLKVLHEQIYGASENISQMISANVAIDAHLFGTLSGTLIIIYCFFSNIQRKAI